MKNESIEFIMAGRRQRRRRWILITGFLAVLACVLCCAMLLLGNTIYPVQDVIRALSGEQLKGVSFAVNTIRLPRMLAGLFAGFAFGAAGCIFQTMLRNPLANPNVIGITSGSSAAAVFCITLLHSNRAVVSVASVIAGLVTVIIIYLLSRGKSFSVGRLILVGIGIQAMLDALISYLLLVGAQQDIPAAIRWLSGSLNGSQMHELPPLVLTVLIFTPIAIVLGKHLSLLELGEQSATSLGVNTDKTRIALILSSVCMIALATATTGPIAFVSFLSGPIAKRLAGAGFSNIIPAGLVGVNLVLAADLIGQFAFEYRFPVGIMTGILGAPYLIFLLIRMNRKGEL
ncbi:iron chelate uptake ABC transporter family permease subunit [Paenibacillus macerans]|uniref:FecCD transport family protein n=1 Tax=Paenibacillus macerans TaxID=44252 RepID=A0A090Y6D1_PAEMA|nr:iron chelate uptake ABC transporter family permease subunit [Paenibacillus macerans]KFM94313.1 fecCD transport family protein [Paenibacillus macerans]MBS5910157.1 iron chelate uptake ABC transporter family permease subunit [Paenibacillus macerans]MCY7557808.1 iron chelate uptake ABC transporter family permease subunit [Paenibacillus macerans]MEC0153501.1 iron chelate uptake ABC transporter family permease subunit [Paenibacillus macerans]MUG20996.1 iron chelate uptake ABC transporter family 